MNKIILTFLLFIAFPLISLAQNEQKIYYSNLYKSKMKSGKTIKRVGGACIGAGCATCIVAFATGSDTYVNPIALTSGVAMIGTGIITGIIGMYREVKYEFKLKDSFGLKVKPDVHHTICLTYNF